jgi:putative membrane protein
MNIAIVGMVFISLFILRDVFKPQREIKIAPYLFFILPLLLAFALPAQSMDSTSMAYGNISLSQKNAGQAGSTPSIDSAQNPTAIPNNNNSSPTGDVTGDNSTANNGPVSDSSSGVTVDDQLKKQGDTYIIGDDNFNMGMNSLFLNLENYDGKKVQIKGFVYREKEFKPNEFVVARLMMACCTADLQPVGFLCNYDKAPELEHDTWITVTGIIKKVKYQGEGELIPIIMVNQVQKAEKPQDEYIYP